MSIIAKVSDWVGEVTATVGTGSVLLGGAIDGFTTFSNIGDGLVWYTIVSGDSKETGVGTLSGIELQRTTVHATYQNNTYTVGGSPISLTGITEVYCTLTATAFGEVNAAMLKLDGIEEGATSDQTSEEIKISYESNADTNEFSDTEKAKLATVEENAAADQDASEVPYDNTTSGLSATEAQAGIDELSAGLNGTDLALAALASLDEFNVKKDADTGSTFIPKGTTAERTSPVEPGLFRFNTETNEFEGHNDTEWGSIGGGGVPAFIYKDASFILETKKAFVVEMGDDVTKIAAIPDGLPNGSWFAISALNWSNTSGVHYFVSTQNEEWNTVGLATDSDTRNIRISQNGTFYFQKIEGKWSVVDGIGEGDASLPVTELQEQIDTLEVAKVVVTPLVATEGQDWDGIDYTDPDAIGANATAKIYPDGSIVGSTDNGNYTKYPNGELLLTYNKVGIVPDVTATAGNSYQSSVFVFTYPIALTVAYAAHADMGYTSVWCSVADILTTDLSFRAFSVLSRPDTSAYSVYISVQGRWK